jgi:hypothetical protein
VVQSGGKVFVNQPAATESSSEERGFVQERTRIEDLQDIGGG